MKAVIYRQVGTMSNEHRQTTMVEDAGSLEVMGTEGVVSVLKADKSVVAVIKLGENDYIKLE